MEGLSLDNILDVEESLFEEDNGLDNNSDDLNEKTTTEIEEEEDLFESESVGSEENNREEEKTISESKEQSSPNNLYSSLVYALQDEGVFSESLDMDISKIKSAEDFVRFMDTQIHNKLDERLKRVDQALNANIEVSEIRKYENVLNYLENINDDLLSSETELGETLRKLIIFQDYINNGFTKERAEREVKKSLNAGTDIEDAKESLLNNKEFFKTLYKNMIDEAQKLEEEKVANRKKELDVLKNSILNDDKVFGELQVDKVTRQKVFENLSKPIYQDPETGEFLTALQKYERENKVEFLKNLSLVYTLTNGFKSMDELVKNKVKKEVKKGIRQLEQTINNTARFDNGDLKFVTGVSEDPNSYIGTWNIDI